MHPTDLTGKRFGRLTAIELCEKTPDGKTAWLCACDCGKIKKVRATHLVSGKIRSCGCLRKEGTHTTHGSSNSRLYSIWSNMKSRCYNPNSTSYKTYGGRGICICDEWRNSFVTFQDWAIANGYSNDLSIDRVDVNGDYVPSNCRWATVHEQAVNKTSSLYIIYNNQKLTVSEVAALLNISPYTLYSRLNKLNWNVDDAIGTVPSYSNCARRSVAK